jgi:hypothetical protein
MIYNITKKKNKRKRNLCNKRNQLIKIVSVILEIGDQILLSKRDKDLRNRGELYFVA